MGSTQVNKSDAGSDRIPGNGIALESDSKNPKIHVSDPRPSESNTIPTPGFHRIRRIPVGFDKILYWVRWEP
ncbi:unnamed protein product, partial [Adineta ricciae]